ncbi:hypothetical protein GWK47_046733 [Chionoecetes opilio]|uniref:Uncharacterized protein n=1 Tax=Chionoecetes opilio TaxID=41210 RepID=A0A8J4YBU5_CHIOP|nr:hypothetical protein GWK47_046733 [Chionoecetes opilio]
MRPRTKEYHHQLPMGLFLMVGFSRQDEARLRAETNGGILDALSPLRAMYSTLSAEMGEKSSQKKSLKKTCVSPLQEECRLDLFQHAQDNLVLQVRHVQLSSGISGHNYTRTCCRRRW